MASVLVPVAYLVIIFGGLFVFSFYYRRHNSRQVYEPYFPSHPERNTYITLLQKKDPPAHDSLLKAALLRRAMADVQRVHRVREDKPALQSLLQKGSVGDNLWNSLLAAERELEAEIVEVVTEANAYVDNWGHGIFATANEMVVNEKMRTAVERVNETKGDIVARYDLNKSTTVSTASNVDPTPSSPNSGPKRTKSSNGLLSPLSHTEPVVSSEGEGSIIATSPKTPKKKASKRK